MSKSMFTIKTKIGPTNAGINDFISTLTSNISYELEKSLLGQLKDFVDRGIIAAEYSKPLLTSTITSKGEEYQYSQVITLKLKDQEYVEHLEKENEELRKKLKDKK